MCNKIDETSATAERTIISPKLDLPASKMWYTRPILSKTTQEQIFPIFREG